MIKPDGVTGLHSAQPPAPPRALQLTWGRNTPEELLELLRESSGIVQ